MKHSISLLLFLLPCSHALAVSPALATPSPTAPIHAVRPIPIAMFGAGVVAGDPTAAGGAPFTAAGVGSHLGSWTNSGTLAIDPATLAAAGSVTFLTADGSQLDATFDGFFDPATGTAAATFHWTGGTGRFANATGDADFVVQQDPSGSFTFVAAGAVSL